MRRTGLTLGGVQSAGETPSSPLDSIERMRTSQALLWLATGVGLSGCTSILGDFSTGSGSRMDGGVDATQKDTGLDAPRNHRNPTRGSTRLPILRTTSLPRHRPKAGRTLHRPRHAKPDRWPAMRVHAATELTEPARCGAARTRAAMRPLLRRERRQLRVYRVVQRRGRPIAQALASIRPTTPSLRRVYRCSGIDGGAPVCADGGCTGLRVTRPIILP